MEVKAGYKETEVGIIPEDWVAINLSEFCTLQRGFDITEATRVSGTIPVYSSSGLSYYHNKAMVSPPGVVTGRKGILGKVFLINEPFWPHDTTLWVKDFKGNHPAYVALVLKNFHLERLDAATAVPTLNRNNLVGYVVAVPTSIAEQKAIAKALSDADALIEALEGLIAKKRHVKQGAMSELMSGRVRLPGFSDEWKVVTFDSLCKTFTKQTGFDYSASIKPSLITKYADGFLPFIQNKDFEGKNINYQTDYFVPEKIAIKFPRILLDEKCLLISISGSIGNVAVFSDHQTSLCRWCDRGWKIY